MCLKRSSTEWIFSSYINKEKVFYISSTHLFYKLFWEIKRNETPYHIFQSGNVVLKKMRSKNYVRFKEDKDYVENKRNLDFVSLACYLVL